MAKVVYIAHQIAGNMSENVADILQICREIHTRDVVPIAPYLIAIQYLDDFIDEERELGISANREYFKRKVMDETWLCGPKISKGMIEEIKLSNEYGIPIRCYNFELEPELQTIIDRFIDAKLSKLKL